MSDEEPLGIPVPLCEFCWLVDHTIWEPESVGEDGKVLMRMTGVDVPEKINTDSVEICGLCGAITVAGIYEFKDPSTVNYLSDGDDNEFSLELDDATSFLVSMNPDDDDSDGKNE